MDDPVTNTPLPTYAVMPNVIAVYQTIYERTYGDLPEKLGIPRDPPFKVGRQI